VLYWERQCSGKPGSEGICAGCVKRRATFEITGTIKCGWNGLITEEPLPESRMLGTAYADAKAARGQLHFTPVPSEKRSYNRSETSSVSTASKPKPKATTAAPKPKPAPKPKAKANAGAGAPPIAPVFAAAAAEGEPEEVRGIATVVQGAFYWRIGNNLYEWDDGSERVGTYAGQLIDGDEADIDRDAPETPDEDDNE
jgi:hypothetical protein